MSELLTASHNHLRHKLVFNDGGLEDVEAQLVRATDPEYNKDDKDDPENEFHKMYLMAWCTVCKSPVTIEATITNQILCLDTNAL